MNKTHKNKTGKYQVEQDKNYDSSSPFIILDMKILNSSNFTFKGK